jgi:NAD+ synthase
VNISKIENHIINWLSSYLKKSPIDGFVVGVSGGVDSAVTSTLCAKTGYPTLVLNMPIHQKSNQFNRSQEHISWLHEKFSNVISAEVDLSRVFDSFSNTLDQSVQDHLTMANLRSRVRMSTLYAYASNQNKIVVGTGNKVEDFGVGFYTKYGDGGVDISPIADLFKTEVFILAKHLKIVSSIQDAPPTDGLWEDDRSDEDQLGASYVELEWAMNYIHLKSLEQCSTRQTEVLKIYKKLNDSNQHKMSPIPVCLIPDDYR